MIKLVIGIGWTVPKKKNTVVRVQSFRVDVIMIIYVKTHTKEKLQTELNMQENLCKHGLFSLLMLCFRLIIQ